MIVPGSDTPAQAPVAPVQSSEPVPAPDPTPAPITPKPIITPPVQNSPWKPLPDANPDTLSKVAVAGQMDATPEFSSKVLEMSSKSGVPADFIAQDPDGFEKQLNDSNFSPENFVQKNPKLADWVAKSPYHYSLIKPDISGIRKYIDSMDEYQYLNLAYDTISALGKSGNQVIAQAAKIPAELYNFAALPQNLLHQIIKEVPEAHLDPENAISRHFENQAKAFDNPASDLNKSVADRIAKGDFSGAGRTAFLKLVEASPSMALLMAGGPEVLALQGVGVAADIESRPENKNVDPALSTMNAAAHGAAMAGSGMVGLGIMGRWQGMLTSQIGKQGALAVVKSFAKTLGYAMTTDALSGSAMSVADDLNDTATGIAPVSPGDILHNSVETGLNFGVMGMAFATPEVYHAAHAYKDMRSAQLTKYHMDNLERIINKLNTQKNSPTKFAEMMKAISENSGNENVHVSADALETLYQSKKNDDGESSHPDESLAKKLADLGVEKEFDHAKETGGTVKIPIEKWFSESMPEEDRGALIDDVTFDPSKPTYNEAEKEYEQYKEEQKLSREHKKSLEDSRKSVMNQVRDQLIKTGMNHSDAEAASSLYSFYHVAAQAEGTTAEELFNRRKLTVSRELPDTLKKKTIDEFDPLLNRIRNGDIPTVGKAKGKSLIEFLRSEGGINHDVQGQDVRDMEIKGISRRNKGMDIDRAAILAHEAGYISAPDVRELIDSIDRDHTKGGVYGANGGDEVANSDRTILTELQSHILKMGIDINTATNEEIKAALENSAKEEMPADFFEFLQKSGDTARGGYKAEENSATIALLKGADLSTFLHESMHHFVQVMRDITAEGGGSERSKEIMASLIKFSGADSYDEMTAKHHEKITEAFENYLMEGKAPSQNLKSAFAVMRAWMIHVYKNFIAAYPKVKLNDEIKNTFDRMLATDEEIAATKQQEAMNPLFDTKEIKTLFNEKEAAAYVALVNKRDQAATGYMTSKMLAQVDKERTKKWKLEKDAVEREKTNEVNERPEYQLLNSIRTSILPDGRELPKDALKLNRKIIEKDFGKEIASQMPKGIWSKDGLHYEVLKDYVADHMSGEELVYMLANTHEAKDVIRDETDAEMRSRHSGEDPAVNGKMREEAVNALHTGDHSAEMMAFEMKWIIDNHPAAYKSLMKKVGQRYLTAAEFKVQAQNKVNGMSVKDIKPYESQRLEVRHSNDAIHHALKGDWTKALESKYNALLNHEIYKASVSAKEFVTETISDFKDMNRDTEFNKKRRDTGYVNATRAILGDYEINTIKQAKTALDYLKMTEDYSPDTYKYLEAQISSATKNKKDYRDLSYQDFISLKSTVDAIWKMSQTAKEIEVAGKQEFIGDAREALISRMAEINADKKVREKVKKQSMYTTKRLAQDAAVTRVEHLVDALDNGDPNGVFKKYIWRPVVDAAVMFRDVKHNVTKEVDAASVFIKNFSHEKIIAHELVNEETGEHHTFDSIHEVQMAILHAGNEGNLEKLLIGYKWGSLIDNGYGKKPTLDTSKWDAFISRMIDEGKLTKEHFDFAQKIWDINDSLKKGAQEAHRKVYGKYFNEVTAKKFTNKFGTYEGGYMPAVYDHDLSPDKEIRDAKMLINGENTSTMFNSLAGSFKDRNDAYHAPMNLNLGLIQSHIDQVIKFTHMRPAVDDVFKIINSREMHEAFKEHDPLLFKDILKPWLDRSLQQSVSSPSKSKTDDTWYKKLRSNYAMQMMFANVKNVVMQVHGFGPAMTKVRGDYMVKAGKEFLFNPYETVNDISEKSLYMKGKFAEQGFNMHEHLNDIVNHDSTVEKTTNFFRDNTYFLQTAAQNMVNVLVWKGAYNEQLSIHGDEETAVRMADEAVSMTQHNFAPESISAKEHGTPFERLFSTFYSYVNLIHNLKGAEYYKARNFMGMKKGFQHAAATALATSIMPAAMMVGLNQMFGASLIDEDGDKSTWDDYLVKMAEVEAHMVTMGFAGPLFGGLLVGAAKGLSNHSTYNPSVSLSPIVNFTESAVKLPGAINKSIHTGKVNGREIQDALSLVGTMTGVPLGPLGRPVNYLRNVKSGKEKPKDVIDVARGLITGKGGKR